eukprot:TRINITY_DN5918_c0_g1_i2.p1 TRINITY_DN5918_c0_g1~~TRINITY_DN5918_c0_g1_i2.p1  ORF type:complete len:101 (-),score=16.67 TRINITY_DN5918_c0_g1_i2:54-356(-)
MPDIWENHYGFLPSLTGVPVMVGEYRLGGWTPVNEWQWQWFRTFIGWATDKKIPLFYFGIEFPSASEFYPGADVLTYLARAQPHPTRITLKNGSFCISNF